MNRFTKSLLLMILILNNSLIFAQNHIFRYFPPNNITYVRIDSSHKTFHWSEGQEDYKPKLLDYLDVKIENNDSLIIIRNSPNLKFLSKNTDMNITDEIITNATTTYVVNQNGEIKSISLAPLITRQIQDNDIESKRIYELAVINKWTSSVGQFIGRSSELGANWQYDLFTPMATGDSVLFYGNAEVIEKNTDSSGDWVTVKYCLVSNDSMLYKMYLNASKMAGYDLDNILGFSQEIFGEVILQPSTMLVKKSYYKEKQIKYEIYDESTQRPDTTYWQTEITSNYVYNE